MISEVDDWIKIDCPGSPVAYVRRSSVSFVSMIHENEYNRNLGMTCYYHWIKIVSNGETVKVLIGGNGNGWLDVYRKFQADLGITP